MNRRDLIALLGSTAVSWPRVGRAQQQERVRRIGVFTRAKRPMMPVIGFLHTQAAVPIAPLVLPAFRQGLDQTGYSEGRNVTIEYRWADGYYDRLPALAAELVSRQVAVIVATGGPVDWQPRQRRRPSSRLRSSVTSPASFVRTPRQPGLPSLITAAS